MRRLLRLTGPTSIRFHIRRHRQGHRQTRHPVYMNILHRLLYCFQAFGLEYPYNCCPKAELLQLCPIVLRRLQQVQ